MSPDARALLATLNNALRALYLAIECHPAPLDHRRLRRAFDAADSVYAELLSLLDEEKPE